MIGHISEENGWPRPKRCLYQHCCGSLSMKPTNNVQKFHDSKMAVDLAEYQKKKMGTQTSLEENEKRWRNCFVADHGGESTGGFKAKNGSWLLLIEDEMNFSEQT
jgi:hypothetical protein